MRISSQLWPTADWQDVFVGLWAESDTRTSLTLPSAKIPGQKMRIAPSALHSRGMSHPGTGRVFRRRREVHRTIELLLSARSQSHHVVAVSHTACMFRQIRQSMDGNCQASAGQVLRIICSCMEYACFVLWPHSPWLRTGRTTRSKIIGTRHCSASQRASCNKSNRKTSAASPSLPTLRYPSRSVVLTAVLLRPRTHLSTSRAAP